MGGRQKPKYDFEDLPVLAEHLMEQLGYRLTKGGNRKKPEGGMLTIFWEEEKDGINTVMGLKGSRVCAELALAQLFKQYPEVLATAFSKFMKDSGDEAMRFAEALQILGVGKVIINGRDASHDPRKPMPPYLEETCEHLTEIVTEVGKADMEHGERRSQGYHRAQIVALGMMATAGTIFKGKNSPESSRHLCRTVKVGIQSLLLGQSLTDVVEVSDEDLTVSLTQLKGLLNKYLGDNKKNSALDKLLNCEPAGSA